MDETTAEPRPEKVAVVKEVRNRLDQANAAILTEYRGLSVKDLATLRRSLRDAGGEYRIYKNTLVRFAVRDLGLDELVPLLEGPTAIAFVNGDAVPVAKTLRDYARTNVHLVVKGGVLGTKVMSSAETAALADLPPRELMLARLAGALAAPMQQFAGLLQALPRSFAYGLKALIDKVDPDGTGRAAAAEPVAAVETSDAEPVVAAEPDAEPVVTAEPGVVAEEPVAAAEPGVVAEEPEAAPEAVADAEPATSAGAEAEVAEPEVADQPASAEPHHPPAE